MTRAKPAPSLGASHHVRPLAEQTSSVVHHSSTPRAGLIPMHFFQEIRDYIGFDQEDEETLIALHDLISPHFAGVVNAFYEALWLNPRTRMVFSGPDQVERLRASLMIWLERVFYGLLHLEKSKRLYLNFDVKVRC